MENETVSKTELNYILTIEKLEAIVDKQEIKIKQQENENLELTNNVASIKALNVTLKEANDTLTKKVSDLDSEIIDTVSQCQEHIDAIEKQNDDLENQIEELKKKILSDDELLFHQGCKADQIFYELHKTQTTSVTHAFLVGINFPIELLDKMEKHESSIETSNFILKRDGEKNYKLSKPQSNGSNQTEVTQTKNA